MGDSQRDSRESIPTIHSQLKPLFLQSVRPIHPNHSNFRFAQIGQSRESPDSHESRESIRAHCFPTGPDLLFLEGSSNQDWQCGTRTFSTGCSERKFRKRSGGWHVPRVPRYIPSCLWNRGAPRRGTSTLRRLLRNVFCRTVLWFSGTPFLDCRVLLKGMPPRALRLDAFTGSPHLKARFKSDAQVDSARFR